jgi:Sec-independent protein translocase protein TatA
MTSSLFILVTIGLIAFTAYQLPAIIRQLVDSMISIQDAKMRKKEKQLELQAKKDKIINELLKS